MRGRISLALGLALTGLCLLSSSTSAAGISFCSFGTGTGQCDRPSGVAVDRTSGHVYVADAGNNRVNVFDEDGDLLFSFGSLGEGAGQLNNPRRIAVDNDPTSPNFHDVYVADSNKRVQRFSSAGAYAATIGGPFKASNPPIAVGPGGDLYVIDSVGSNDQLNIFDPAGASSGSSTLPSSDWEGLAVNSLGDFYVSRQRGTGAIEKYEPTEPAATLLGSFNEGSNTTAIAVGPEDTLFAAQRDGDINVIARRAPSGALVKRFGYGQIEFNLFGLAVGSTGDLFGAETFTSFNTSKVIRLSEPPPGPLLCCLNSIPGNTKASLKSTVNPEGKPTTFHVDYITQGDYVENGNKFEGVNPPISTPESASIGSDFELHNVEAQIGCVKPTVPPQPTCLEPSTAYRYRLVASNEDGKAEAEGSFTTLPPFEVEETFVTDVGIDAGRLHAVVNPFGIPATGYFEYVDDANYQADLAEGEGHDGFAQALSAPDVDAGQSPISLGEGEAGKEVGRELSGLAGDTTYHYRFMVTDPFVTAPGPERQIRTFPIPTPPTNSCPNQQFRTAASAMLPDCRAFEMVSPVDKNGSDIKVLEDGERYPARLDQSSLDGNRFAYSSSTAFGDAKSAPWSSEYLATRTSEGWSTHSLNAPRESVSLSNQFELKIDVPHRLFDSTLSDGWLLHLTEPPLDECAPPGFINLYRQDTTTGKYEALVTVEPMTPLPEGYRVELQGVSADGTRAVFGAGVKLTQDAVTPPSGSDFQLYEHIADEGCGELRLVSYMPDGSAATLRASAGRPGQPGTNRSGMMARAVSADGTRIFFTISALGSSHLYVRINADQEQSPVSEGKCTDPSLGCTLLVSSNAATRFWTATPSGSKAIYSAGTSLYEFDLDKALAGEPASTLVADGLNGAQGVAAASEDLSRIYFVSIKALGGEGEANKPNLYLSEEGQVRLVATLRAFSSSTVLPFAFFVGSQFAIKNGARATPDGSHLAFVTTASPTGYDNADAVDDEPNLELYLYDAETDEVRCISCNPSGARPRGREFVVFPKSIRVSAFMAHGANDLFNPRSLSTDGNRLFFESFEALLPRDTNGKADVYEWQRAGGEKACEEVGAELYVPSSGGCLSLISSGQSPVDSEFADASPDGHDVFIRTQSSLLPQDDGLVDIYDARINGGFAQPPLPPAACEGEACQGPLEEPNDPTPASSAFEGAGNVAEEPVARCRKPKVRRKGRCVARKGRKTQTGKEKRQSKQRPGK